MAIDYGITSLDTGASDINYTGNQGPKSPEQERMMSGIDTPGFELQPLELLLEEFREDNNGEEPKSIDDLRRFFHNKYGPKGIAKVEQAIQQAQQSKQMASADPILQDEYDQYVFDLQEHNPGVKPMSIEQFREQAISGMAGGGIARLGFQFGGHPHSSDSPGGSGQTSAGGSGEGQSGPGNIHFDVVEQARAQAAEVAAQRAAQAKIESIPNLTAEQVINPRNMNVNLKDTVVLEPTNIVDPFPNKLGLREEPLEYSTINEFGYDYPTYEDQFAFEDNKTASQRAAQLAAEEAWDEKSPRQKELIQGRWDLGEEQFDTTDTGTTEGGLGEGITDTGIATDTGTTATAADTFEDAKAAAIAEAQAAAETRGLPFEHYYVGGDPTAEQEKFMQEHRAAASMVGKEAWPAAEGGVARQRYGLGSLVKKAFKAVKKIAKSPVGMMALTGVLGGLPLFGQTGAKQSAWAKWLKPALMGRKHISRTMHPKERVIESTSNVGGIWNWIKNNPGWAIAGASAAPFLFQDEYPTDVHPGTGDYGEGLDLLGIRKKILAKKGTQEEFPYLNPEYYAPSAQGGRIGYQDAGPVNMRMASHPVNDQILENLYDEYYDRLKSLGHSDDKIHEIIMDIFESLPMGPEGRAPVEETGIMKAAQGGRIGYKKGGNDEEEDHRAAALSAMYRPGAQEGGLMNLGGMEKDYRQEGGFVPIGGQEKADDVPARLSKNEFVFTADAVRAAGGGDIDKGAEVMENVMDNLEQGGQVSQESQGLEGARNMFATAQRLEGVL